MKRFTLLSLIIGMVSYASSQNLEITHNGTIVKSGDTFNVPLGKIGWHQIEMNVKNTAATPQTFYAKKTEVSILEGSSNYFCFQNCYTPSTYVSPAVTIAAGGSIIFSGDYEGLDNRDGVSTLRYDFYNANNESQTMYITINYIEGLGSGINEYFESDNGIFFERENGTWKIVYHFKDAEERTLAVYNLTGNKISQTRISDISGRIYLQQLPPGIYIYQLSESGKIAKIAKLIVAK